MISKFRVPLISLFSTLALNLYLDAVRVHNSMQEQHVGPEICTYVHEMYILTRDGLEILSRKLDFARLFGRLDIWFSCNQISGIRLRPDIEQN